MNTAYTEFGDAFYNAVKTVHSTTYMIPMSCPLNFPNGQHFLKKPKPLQEITVNTMKQVSTNSLPSGRQQPKN